MKKFFNAFMSVMYIVVAMIYCVAFACIVSEGQDAASQPGPAVVPSPVLVVPPTLAPAPGFLAVTIDSGRGGMVRNGVVSAAGSGSAPFKAGDRVAFAASYDVELPGVRGTFVRDDDVIAIVSGWNPSDHGGRVGKGRPPGPR